MGQPEHADVDVGGAGGHEPAPADAGGHHAAVAVEASHRDRPCQPPPPRGSFSGSRAGQHQRLAARAAGRDLDLVVGVLVEPVREPGVEAQIEPRRHEPGRVEPRLDGAEQGRRAAERVGGDRKREPDHVDGDRHGDGGAGGVRQPTRRPTRIADPSRP